MHMLYNHGHPKLNQALLGHEKSESSDVYTKVFSLDVAARQQVRFNRETGAVLQLHRATPGPSESNIRHRSTGRNSKTLH